MSIFVVRHAKAGKRAEWEGEDRLRPLSPAGRRQADAIATRLADDRVTALWSSPYLRCIETLEPLAERTGLIVKSDDRLGEGARLVDALDVLHEAGDGAVLSSHGDVIPELIEGLIRRGADVTGPPNWRKGSTWILDLDGDDVVSLRAEPPPS